MSDHQELLKETDAGLKSSPWLVAVGSVFGAIAASSCCLVPLALFSVGVTGAWMGNLSALAPYQPIFIAATVAFLVVGFWLVYRRPNAACNVEARCGRPMSRRLVLTGLWSSTALVIAAALFPYVGPYLLGV